MSNSSASIFSSYRPLTPHFITGSGFSPPQTFLADSEYSRALDCLVKACNDFLVFDRDEKVLIGRRTQLPQRDWWFSCGGRMKPGESIRESASRILKRELKLSIDADSLKSRLVTVGHFGFGWEWREQEPKRNGTSDISVLTAIQITDEEKAAIEMAGEEARQWVEISSIVRSPSPYHPAMIRGLEDFLQLQRLNSISAAIDSGSVSDAELASLTRLYIKNQRRLAATDAETIWTEENIEKN